MNTLYYFIKIAKKNKVMIIVYIAILIVITMLTSGSYQDTYSKTALNIGIVKNEESQFANALIDYLDRENNLYYYDSQEAAELDFYTRFIDGIVEIPAGAEKTLLETEDAALKVSTDITNSQSIFLQRVVVNTRFIIKRWQMQISWIYKSFPMRSMRGRRRLLGQSARYRKEISRVCERIRLCHDDSVKAVGDLNISFSKKTFKSKPHFREKQHRFKGEISLAQIIIALLVFALVTGFVLVVFFRDMFASDVWRIIC